MTIEEKVYALLGANTGITALVSAAHIKPPGDWQNLPRPYIVHFPVAPDVTPLHNTPAAALKAWRSYQVSVFADKYSTARALAVAVVNALSGQHDGVTFQWIGQTCMFEPDVRVHQIALEFEVWEALD